MFGPSEWAFNGITNHHRSPDFHRFLRGLEEAFKRTFDIQENWTVLFMPGGGTLANEIVLSSCVSEVVGPDLPFVERLRRLSRYSGRNHVWGGYNGPIIRACVAYDTATSTVLPVLPSDRMMTFADCVSSFPYYDIPVDVDAWSTVSGKQLGASPGIGILALSPRFRTAVHSSSSRSILSLSDWLDFHDRGEQPHTPATQLLENLFDHISHFNVETLRKSIDERRNLLEKFVPADKYMGTGPVFTFLADALPKSLVRKWDIYPGSVGPQLFLHAVGDWTGLLNDLKGIRWN